MSPSLRWWLVLRLGLLTLLGLVSVASGASASELSIAVVDAAGQPLLGGELPLAMTPPPERGAEDPEAFRVLLHAERVEQLPASLALSSLSAAGQGVTGVLAVLPQVALNRVTCPSSFGAGVCAQSPALRLVIDELDSQHPLLVGLSLLASLGGQVLISAGGLDLRATVRGAFPRARARLRPHLVRLSPRGPAPLGRDDAHAIGLVADEIQRASQIWSVCGIEFESAPIRIVEPPPPSLISVGCGSGLDASGGKISLTIDGKAIELASTAGLSARAAARKLAEAISAAGFKPTISDNARAPAAARVTTDLIVRRRDGELAVVAAPKLHRISTDATLEVCIGRVDLEDGLQHFSDADAVVGTLEERTLIKAFDDGDPATFELFVIPSFGQNPRIGESFIFSDNGAIKNVVVEDRAGFRAHRGSFTMAHELGHLLLDQPGHSDDFGSDTPTRLMDADAVLGSAFGPRRLTHEECLRAVRQSGPQSPAAALRPVP